MANSKRIKVVSISSTQKPLFMFLCSTRVEIADVLIKQESRDTHRKTTEGLLQIDPSLEERLTE